MRLKWIGLIILVFVDLISPLYNHIFWHISLLILVIIGVILIFIDCRIDDKEYIKKVASKKSDIEKIGAHF